MTLFIDADACPVTRIAIDLAAAQEIKSVLVCDVSHNMVKDGAETILVEKGADSADMKIVSLIAKGDVVVTQDYGLAALVLAKRGYALNQNGLIFTDDNIASLLEQRHFAKKYATEAAGFAFPQSAQSKTTRTLYARLQAF